VESYPRVILEAMAFELPIITTPVFGVREQIPESTDAQFYEPGDIAKLGEHLIAMAHSADCRKIYGNRSLQRFAQMPNFGEMLKSYFQVLQDASRYGR
jgi:O-antigen biosynthesis protein